MTSRYGARSGTGTLPTFAPVMPRFNPNPSTFDRFPGEVVLAILRQFLEVRPRELRALKAFVAATIPFQRLSRKFKLAIDVIIGLHFHTFIYPRHNGVHIDHAPWHINTSDGLFKHRDYWKFYQGEDAVQIPVFGDIVNTLTIPRIPTLRCISLDIRAMEPITKPSLRRWKLVHAPRWVQTTSILTRIAMGACGIEELNLRLSPQQEMLNIVQEIVDRNKRLRIIRIDVDTAVVSNRNIRPTIRLDKMFESYQTREPIATLIIRAPGCNIKTWATSSQLQERFFAHLRETKEIVLACHVFNALLPTLVWTYHLLRHMPKLEAGDIAIHAADSHKISTMANSDLPLLHMHALDKLSLQIPEVDTHFLRKINALCLYKLRIRSSVPVSSWPHCVDNHFPNLFIANIMCPGPSAVRVRALGVPHRWYYQNLGVVHNYERPHNLPFLAYIKPYSRQRHEHSPSPTPEVMPYQVPEATEPAWEEEDSDASTGSDLSELEDEDEEEDETLGSSSSDSDGSDTDDSDSQSLGTTSLETDTSWPQITPTIFPHQDSVSPNPSDAGVSPVFPHQDTAPSHVSDADPPPPTQQAGPSLSTESTSIDGNSAEHSETTATDVLQQHDQLSPLSPCASSTLASSSTTSSPLDPRPQKRARLSSP
ncbi:hypothetical protein CF326_g1710 [Tilletia indica]|nr:hypothetical protein CF326_g1710 [Tilletia indica]